MVTIERPTRVFLLGSVRLPDPDPALSVDDVLKLYTPNYPVLAHATVDEPPEAVGDELHYTIRKPPVTTKG